MTREERKEYNYWLNRRTIDDKVEKQCSQCKEWLEETIENFYLRNKSKPELGFAPECKICAGKRARKWSVNHNDKCRESSRKNRKTLKRKKNERERHQRRLARGYFEDYQENNPNKFKIYTENHRIHDITRSEEEALLKVFDYSCAYCGMTLQEHKKKFKQKLHNDHVDHNGHNDLRNDVPACKQCNSYKWQHDMEEWFREQEFFSEDRYNKIIWWTTEGYKQYIEDKPPYIIRREKNEYNNKFHWNLWSVDEKRNMINIISTKNKKKDLDKNIEEYLLHIGK